MGTIFVWVNRWFTCVLRQDVWSLLALLGLSLGLVGSALFLDLPFNFQSFAQYPLGGFGCNVANVGQGLFWGCLSLSMSLKKLLVHLLSQPNFYVVYFSMFGGVALASKFGKGFLVHVVCSAWVYLGLAPIHHAGISNVLKIFTALIDYFFKSEGSFSDVLKTVLDVMSDFLLEHSFIYVALGGLAFYHERKGVITARGVDRFVLKIILVPCILNLHKSIYEGFALYGGGAFYGLFFVYFFFKLVKMLPTINNPKLEDHSLMFDVTFNKKDYPVQLTAYHVLLFCIFVTFLCVMVSGFSLKKMSMLYSGEPLFDGFWWMSA